MVTFCVATGTSSEGPLVSVVSVFPHWHDAFQFLPFVLCGTNTVKYKMNGERVFGLPHRSNWAIL